MNMSISGSVVENNEADSFKVYIRSRPISEKELNSVEIGKEPNIIKKEDNMVFVMSMIKGKELRPREERSYVFNDVFDENMSTTKMYKKVLTPAVSHIMDGYNSTVLAYGMTGAGKTYTMFGDIYNSEAEPSSQAGVITLMVQDLFEAFAKEEQEGFICQMKFSYLEIYNEQIKDLLSPQANENLMIIEDPVKGVCIPNLSSHNINACDDIINLIIRGNSKRAMASTNSNQFSSRSHAILQITVEKRTRARDIVETFTQSKLCLVDLAGSERAAVSENRGLRQMEGANINRSLLALGNCINVLSDPNTKGAFVPYRDSKLTRLLKDSLGGNTKTIMIACISPFYMAYEETVNTLKYASNARRIKRKIVKNVNEVEMHISEYRDIINSLKSEIDILKKQLKDNHKDRKFDDQKQQTMNIENVFDTLGEKLLENLEENSQINQTLKELSALKIQNEMALKNKIKELEQSYNDIDAFTRISQEVISLKRIMENNEKIEKEEQMSLKRNLEEKKEFQLKIVQLSDKSLKNNTLYYQKLEKNLETLNFERLALRNQNQQVSQEAQTLAKEKAEKDGQIISLQNLVYNMQLQLSEKDKQLEYNQQVISSILTQNPQVQSPGTSFVQSLNKSQINLEKTENVENSTPSKINIKTMSIEKEIEIEVEGTTLASSKLDKKQSWRSKSSKEFKNQEVCISRRSKSLSLLSNLITSFGVNENISEKRKSEQPAAITRTKDNMTSEISCIVPQQMEQSLDLSVKDLIFENFDSQNPQDKNSNEMDLANMLVEGTSDQTLNYLEKLSNDLGSMRKTLTSSGAQKTTYSQQRDLMKEAKANITPRKAQSPVKKSELNVPVSPQINIPSLGIAREFAKNFKVKLNNLVSAAEKNLLDASSIAIISQLAKEYNEYKAYLSENDYVTLKKLGIMAIEKFGEGRSQPSTKKESTRSLSSNSLAKRTKNLSSVVQELHQNKTPVVVVQPKKIVEGEGKVLKRPTGKNQGKAGILSNINSNYSKALNKFCKTQTSTKLNSGTKTTHVLLNQKETNENYQEDQVVQSQSQTQIEIKERPQEEKDLSIIQALKRSMPVVEVSQFNPEVNLNIIDNNRAEMKLKMQKMREKFEQIQKKSMVVTEKLQPECNEEIKLEPIVAPVE